MKNHRYICVFDLETDGTDTDSCSPVQIAAVILHPRNLDILDKFESDIQPALLREDKYFENHRENIEWHAKNNKVTTAEILERWFKAPDIKTVLQNFCDFNFKWHTRQTNHGSFTAPIPAGYNIVNFDLPIMLRLARQYGYADTKLRSKLFSSVNKFDLYDMIFVWFENLAEPEKLNAETIYPFLGLKTEGIHDAMRDVEMTAKVLSRFLLFHRRIAPTSEKFRGKLSAHND